jgi:hypothetical protein
VRGAWLHVPRIWSHKHPHKFDDQPVLEDCEATHCLALLRHQINSTDLRAFFGRTRCSEYSVASPGEPSLLRLWLCGASDGENFQTQSTLRLHVSDDGSCASAHGARSCNEPCATSCNCARSCNEQFAVRTTQPQYDEYACDDRSLCQAFRRSIVQDDLHGGMESVR